jgi:hypothetical protein
VLYTALACLATWPLVLHLDTHLAAIPGELGQDVWQHAWNLWWVKHALLVEHTNPYETRWLFYPQGASLYLHSLNLPLGIIGLPLLPLVGIVATYNLLTLLVIVLVAYTTFLLAQYATGNSAAALVAGVIVLCSPQRLFELRAAQLATLSDYTLPLALLAMLVVLEKRTWRTAALAALVMLVTGLSKWYHLFHVALALTPLLLWRLVVAWRSARASPPLRVLWHEAVPWLRTGVLTTLFSVPFLLPAVFESLGSSYARKSDDLVFSTDITLVLPDTVGGIWHTVPPDWWEYYIFAWVPLLLVLAGLLLAPRMSARWLAVALFCFILSLGPTLHVAGDDTGIPMPYALFRFLPVVDTLRAPIRINSVTTLMLGMVAACGLAHLLRRWSVSVRGGWVVALAITVLITVEAVRLPFPLVDAQVSPFYERVAEEPGEWSVLELPLNRFERDRLEMYTQTYHHKYILTGLISRSAPRMPQEAVPLFKQLETTDTRADIVGMTAAERAQLLRAMRVRYLVVRDDPSRSARAQSQADTAQRLIGPLTEVYADETLRGYRLDAVAAWLDEEGRTTRAEMPLFVGLDSRWNPLEPDGEELTRWLPPEGAGLWTYTEHSRRVVLVFSLYSRAGARPLDVWLNGRYHHTLPIAAGHRLRCYMSAPLELPAGASVIDLYAPQGGVVQGDDPRSLSFSIHQIDVRDVQE